ncbi:hypothetical protein LCGC14_0404030 [marine sediment metagenome]|uniref:Peptidase M28 domain-containing protein n=1 Tax=marine sediment metagenome TaxID=412755 RepID=A0A0F9T1H9_9ZZZZ
MDTYWYNKLLPLLKVQTNSENEKLMVLYLDKELRKLKLPYTIDSAGNILVTKGKAKLYPCVVSHMDTVYDFVDNFELCVDRDDNDILFAISGKQRIGVGGDDKCGILACLYMLNVLPVIKVVFFSGEESGCKGSRKINHKFFTDCMYIIQLDRRGKRDFIQTYWGKKTVSHEFSSEIGLVKKKYRYKNAIGTITDVMTLWDNNVGVSCINISCGYYRPHSEYEHISVADLWNSMKFTEEVINTMQIKRYPSLPPPPVTVVYKSLYSQCCKCKKWKKDVLLYEVRGSNPKEVMCWPCKKKIYDKKNNKKQDNKKPTGSRPRNPEGHKQNIVPFAGTEFACHECGVIATDLKPGDSLKPFMVGKVEYLYCKGCRALLEVSNDEDTPIVCESCQEIIPENHYSTMVQGLLVCGECANVLREYIGKDTIKKCWVCDKVIPKDHKIIERFGTRVCEDCACPSDTRLN